MVAFSASFAFESPHSPCVPRCLARSPSQIVWREQFSQLHPVRKGQFAEQARRLLAGEPLLSNGPRPVAQDEDDDEINAKMADMDDDGLLF